MEIIEIHDVHGRVWLVNCDDIIAVRIDDINIEIFVRGIPEAIFLGVEADNSSLAYRTASDLITGSYAIFKSVPN